MTGYVWAIMLSVSAAASFAIPKFSKIFGSQLRFIAVFTLINSVSMVLVALSEGFGWPYSCSASMLPLPRQHRLCQWPLSVNRVHSDIRATALSSYSMMFALSDMRKF